MAVVSGTSKEVRINSIEKLTMGAATTAADGITFEVKGSDEYVVLVFQNTDGSSAYDMTIKAPVNGSYAATDTDLKISDIPAGGIAVARVESARFVESTGTNKGKIKLVPENIAVKAMIVY